MKVYRNLFEEIISVENLLEAWDDFKRGKRRKADVQLFERHLGDNLFKLHRELIHKRYRHGEYVDFYVHDPKLRHIHKAAVRDRVVHHAVFRLLNPIFESTFVADSYLRYTDDFVILHHDNKYLAVLKDKIADFLKTRLDLSLHPTKVQIRKLRQGIDYLGYVSLPYARVPRVKVRRRIFRKLRHRVQQFKAGLISEESLMRSFDSYMGFLVHANSHKLREKLLQRFWQWVKEPPQKTKRDSRPAAHID